MQSNVLIKSAMTPWEAATLFGRHMGFIEGPGDNVAEEVSEEDTKAAAGLVSSSWISPPPYHHLLTSPDHFR